jgi:hypothetical protein
MTGAADTSTGIRWRQAMVKQMLWEAGVVITVLGGVTSGLAQEKPLPPRKAEGQRPAGQAEEETPKEKVAKRRMAKLEALLKKVESPDHKKEVNDRGAGRGEKSGAMSRKSHTCLICRLTRVTKVSADKTTTEYEENECSRWYTANVEPKHMHVWEASTCVYETDDRGKVIAVGCNPGHYPIWLLSQETQLAVYQHFKKPTEARDLFLSLADAKTYNDRLDEHDQDKGHLIVDALEEWEAAGFPGTWKEWWESWHAKHVEEHKEWLTWLHSDSGLNFWDWQRQRKAGQGAAAVAPKSKK